MRSWEMLVAQALERWETPFYLSAWDPVASSVQALESMDFGAPTRHWLSLKTHPVAPLLREWLRSGRGVEVVSEFELCAALAEGVPPELVVVNGVAKHRWLHKYAAKGLIVQFDSIREVRELTESAKSCEWTTGVRIQPQCERDPDEPQFPTQFGMTREEVAEAVRHLRERGIPPRVAHFHLRTDVPSASAFAEAIDDVGETCAYAQWEPQFLNCGGGLPVRGEQYLESREERAVFGPVELQTVLCDVSKKIPGVTEIWFENGRFMTSASAVLVLTVADMKQRDGTRFAICDGGRTNSALPSDWERHSILTIPRRCGIEVLTTVCGPTCMSYDRMVRAQLPNDLGVGDHLIWMNAGAYHIPWETRFSHGHIRVIWCGAEGSLCEAREAQSFANWWGVWS